MTALGGLALAIGGLVDAAIVMVENGYRHLSETGSPSSIPDSSDEHVITSPPASATKSGVPERERRRILIAAARQVGPALFFSLLIIVVSFLPVFLLEAQEGRMFKPLAWTKTLAVGFSSLLAITLVPVLMIIFIKGKLRPESEKPGLESYPGGLPACIAALPQIPQDHAALEPAIPACDFPADVSPGQPVHAATLRRLLTLHAHFTARDRHHASIPAVAGAGPGVALLSRSRKRLRHGGPL